MRKPIIGVTCSEGDEKTTIFLRKNYLQSILDAGGIPVIIPYNGTQGDYAQLAEELDGFLFSGGMDVQPFLFGEETLAQCGAATPDRDELEMLLYKEVMARKKPVLGICRGIQMMNIAQGGTIYQDIPAYFKGTLEDGTKLSHSQASPGRVASHTVEVAPGSLLEELVGADSIRVNSFHHQAVKDAAPGTVVTGRSKDGLIEALEIPEHGFWLAVQWHPEYMTRDTDTAAALFRGLVEAAKTYGI